MPLLETHIRMKNSGVLAVERAPRAGGASSVGNLVYLGLFL